MKTKLAMVIVLICAVDVRAQVAAPDPAALVAVARGTVQTLQTTGASWRVRMSTGAATLEVDVLRTPEARRLIYRVTDARGAVTELARVLETADAWHVTEGASRRRCRPYEADFDFPVVSLMHEFAELRMVTEDVAPLLGKPTSREGDMVHYALPPNNAAAMRNIVKEYEAFEAANPGKLTDTMRQNMAAARRLLENGLPATIDVRTGIFTQSSGARLNPTLGDFRWLERGAIPAAELKVDDGAAWENLATDPTAGGAGRLDNLAMLGHAGYWRAGTKSGDTDSVLVDLATGAARRIPYRGPASVPGCFLKDRSAVVVCGLDMTQGGLRLCEVNLKTGANRPLGGVALAGGNTLMPTLSPDGRTIAAHYKGTTGSILDSQIALVDVASGEGRLIGKAFDGAFASWLPDGKGLIVLKREHPGGDLKAASINVICRMSIDTGELTPLFKGDAPLVLGDGKSILFQQVDGERAWMTCGFDGSDAKPLPTGGLAKVNFVANGPDGHRLLLMSFAQGKAPQPAILDLATGKSQAVAVGRGLWAMPAWR